MGTRLLCRYGEVPEDSADIRISVFVREQHFENEFDETDKISTHYVLYKQDMPVATLRSYLLTEDDGLCIGRVSVVKEFRGRGIGKEIMEKAEKELVKQGMSGKTVWVHSQCTAAGFYEKLGYEASGNIDDDEGVPHVWMKKILI